MKRLTKNKAHTFFEYFDTALFALIIISLFLHHRINGFFVMLLILYAVVKVVFKIMPLKGYQQLWVFPAIFTLLCIGIIYSENVGRSWTLLERNLSFLFLPLATQAIFQISFKNTQILLNVLIYSALGFSLYCLAIVGLNAYGNGSIYVIPNDRHFLYNMFMHHRLSSPLGLHAVYFSLFIAFANIGTLYLFLLRLKTKYSWWFGILFLFFSGMIYLLKSANLGLGFVLCSILTVFLFYGRQIFLSRRIMVISSISLVVLLIFAFFTVSSKIESFSLNHEMSNEQMSAVGVRLSIWECAFEVVKEHWFFGAGTGDGQNELRKVYEENNFRIGLNEDFNAHNMFLEYWMSNGIFMLLLFSASFIILFKKAITSKNILFISFVILFLLFSFTESTLRTQKGIVFFIFFGSMFYWQPMLWMNEKLTK